MDTEQIKKIMQKVIDIKIKKQQQYNAGLIRRHDYYFICGAEISLINEIYKKTLRLLSIHTSGIKDIEESKQDSLFDIIGYCLDYLEYLDNVQK